MTGGGPASSASPDLHNVLPNALESRDAFVHVANVPPTNTRLGPAASELLPPIHKNTVFSPQSEGSSGPNAHNPVEGQNGPMQWRLSPNSNRLPRPSERFYMSLKAPDLEVEDVTDWSTVTFFTSLYLKFNHALSPIVHKPTFAHDLATRRDKTDRQFRSFLLGLST